MNPTILGILVIIFLFVLCCIIGIIYLFITSIVYSIFKILDERGLQEDSYLIIKSIAWPALLLEKIIAAPYWLLKKLLG